MAPQLTFVYRSHYDGLLSKRVVDLPHASLLEWFREGWSAPDPRTFVLESLQGHVYGLATAFERARELGIEAPATHAALIAHLDEHLYVEGEIRHDAHTLRVLTDDDEVELAYFFFDAHALDEHADDLAYLLQDWPLPTTHDEGHGKASFEPELELPALRPAGTGEGATYVVLGTFYDSDSLPGGSFVIHGARLPQLSHHLRSVVPQRMPPTSWGYESPWPLELRLLRGLVRDGEASLALALERLRDYPVEALGQGSTGALGIADHAAAVADFSTAAASLRPNSGESKHTRLELAEHVAVVAQHVSEFFGHQQWFLFDDRWAAAHPALARSLLRYGVHWDPLA